MLTPTEPLVNKIQLLWHFKIIWYRILPVNDNIKQFIFVQPIFNRHYNKIYLTIPEFRQNKVIFNKQSPIGWICRKILSGTKSLTEKRYFITIWLFSNGILNYFCIIRIGIDEHKTWTEIRVELLLVYCQKST